MVNGYNNKITSKANVFLIVYLLKGIYEALKGAILYFAHCELEYLCLDKQTTSFKKIPSNKFTELVYLGECFTPLSNY